MNNFTLKLTAIFLFVAVFQTHAQIQDGEKYTLKNKATGKYLSAVLDGTTTQDYYEPVDAASGAKTQFTFFVKSHTSNGNTTEGMFVIQGTRGAMRITGTGDVINTTKKATAITGTSDGDKKAVVTNVSGNDYTVKISGLFLTDLNNGNYSGGTQDDDTSVWTIEAAVLSNDKLDDSSVFMSNPVKDNVSITGLTSEINQIHVYSLLGAKVLFQEVNNATSLQMNVSGLSKGMYIVDFVGENGNFTKKLIKE